MKDLISIKDGIVEAMLAYVPADGWSWEAAEKAATEAGFQDAMPRAVFPEGLSDMVAHFSDLIDRRMMEKLETMSTEGIRVRDRIRLAMQTRLDVLESLQAHGAVKASLAFWALPMRVFQGQRVLWRTADRIWVWAGDEAQDYNRYTKRGLLSSLIIGTTLVWIDNPEDRLKTDAFLDRRIENIMAIGRTIGTIGQKIPDIAKTSRTAHK